MLQKSDKRLRLGIGRALTVTALFLYGISSPSVASAAQEDAAVPASPTVSYARIADLVTVSPTIATVRIRSAAALPAERAPGLPAGQARFYLEADTSGLIRGDTVIARRVGFLVDGSAARARKPGLKDRTFIIFGRPGARIDQVQLTSSTALIDWSPANEALVRKVIADAMAADVPPEISDISSAFHVAGAIMGEGETQVFLETSDGTPISLSIIRRPDEQPHFSASLGEVVDDAASLPPPGTMLWYRLACGLPERLPARALRGIERADADAASRDYSAFRRALAPCDRAANPVI